VMRFIENSDRTDAREAIAMKRALWAGTFGYYIQQMLQPQLKDNFQPVFPPNSPERLILAARFYFTNFVFGRGPLPAFRVGSQPYGVLPVCADMLKRSDPRQMTWNDNFVDAFLVRLHDKMARSRTPGLSRYRTWLRLVPAKCECKAARCSSHAGELCRMAYGEAYWPPVSSRIRRFQGQADCLDQFASCSGSGSPFRNEYPNLLSDWAHF
jgi:hypothetical protein